MAIWDFGRGGVKGIWEEFRRINAYMEEVRLLLGNSYKDLLLKGKRITPHAIKNIFLGETDETFTMKRMMNYHNETAGLSLDPATLKHYKVTQRYLYSYVASSYKAEGGAQWKRHAR